MPTPDWLTLGAAFLAALLGGGHCAAMCGGIATGVSALHGGSGWRPAVEANGSRVLGYVLAGAIAGGVGHGIVTFARSDTLALALRMAVGLVLLIAALRLLDVRSRFNPFARASARLWQRLQPLARRIGPGNSALRRIALGMLWGWLPCGLSTTLLAAAWLQGDALHGALTMAAFGLGTLPVMLPLTWSGQRLGRWLQRPALRSAAGIVIAGAGLVTLGAPWLMHLPQMHGVLSMLGCLSMPATG
ncbi:sulfite exporter TauE/SafE family protein [Chiayiivirga flava]|uniref:Urease accessory protein UreH-like transmembrane domain-containing protein n=1 Tax=Chiayiivirga flava TaxID=659595 RepID=A0A7W8G0Y2_9GAMM|nr:sulfite exporter TauE/SafE family protein [Chiayiivirga flava]MBB5207110.1 hypothetical protein [Chiayiivirga flava]